MSTPLQPQQKSKSRLGRGLSSLISVSELPVEVETAPTGGTDCPGHTSRRRRTRSADNHAGFIRIGPAMPAMGRPIEIPVEESRPNPHQPRREMNEALLAELAASIKSTGLIQPIVVRQGVSGYQLIAGERRLRAAKLAGLKTIPGIVRDVDSYAQAQMALVENIQREDLNPIDRAQAYRTLASQLGLTQQELATRLGEDRTTIAHFLRVLELSEPVRELIRGGKLSFGHAKLLAGVSDILEQQRLAELCIAQDCPSATLNGLSTMQHHQRPRQLDQPTYLPTCSIWKRQSPDSSACVSKCAAARKGRAEWSSITARSTSLMN